MANVMTIDMRANTESARDDIKATLNQAAQAAREFRQEMSQLREAQLRAREAVNSTREAFHQTQVGINRAREALRGYTADLNKATQEQARLSNERIRLAAQVEKAQKAYESARKGLAFGAISGVESTQSRAALQNLTQLKQRLDDVSKAHASASGSVGYYRRQVKQSQQDIDALNGTLNTHRLSLRRATDDSARLATTKSALSNRTADNTAKTRELNATLRQHQQALRDDDAAMRSLDDGMAGALIGAALMDRALRAVWTTLKDLILQSTLYAGRTVELQVALENVGRVQGWNVGQLRAMENAIRSLGITTQDARKTLIQFAATGLNMELAPQLARVAQDLAVIAGVDTSEEITRLVAGIETLQIRALRTAGVFVSLEGEMKKAAQTSRRSVLSFSEQEKQQILLNAVLDYGARATGTYDQAMTTASKQMRTMNRLTAEMHNAIGALFQGPFGLAIKLMSEFLRLVTVAPQQFVIFATAIGLFVAKVAYSALANAKWAASFRDVAASLIDATRQTLGLSAAQTRLTQTTAMAAAAGGGAARGAAVNGVGNFIGRGGPITGITGAAATGAAGSSVLGLGGGAATAGAAGVLTGGWLLLGAAITAATVAAYKYATAESTVTFANQENLRTTQRQIDVNRQDAAAFRERAQALRQTGHDILMSDEQRKDATREEAMALMRLNPLQRQAIQNDANRATVLENLAAGLDRVNVKLRTQVRELNRMTVTGLSDSERQIESLMQRAEQGRQRNTAYNQSSPSAFLNEWAESVAGLVGLGSGSYGGDVGTQRVMEDSAKAQGAIQDRRNALRGLAEQERDIRLRTNQSTDAILAQEFGVKQGTKAYEEIIAAVSAYSKEQDDNNGIIREAQDLHNQIVRSLEQMRLAQFDVTVTAEGMSKQQENLHNMLKGGIELGMDWSTVVGGAQSAIRALDQDLMRTSQSQEEYNSRIAALDPLERQAIFDTNASAKAFEAYGESVGKANKRLVELKNSIRDTIRELVALQTGSGELAGLQSVEYAVKREMEARRRLQEAELERYGDVREQPVTAEEIDEATRRIQGQLEMVRGAREAIFRLERMEVEGTTLQYQLMQQQNELLNEETRQRERQMTVATTFLRMQQDRITQEKQLTAEVAARYRMEAEEGENRRRGIGRDRIAYLQAVDTRQKVQLDLRGGIEALRADVQLRRDIAGGGGPNIGDFSYLKRFDTIDPTKRDLAVVNLMTQEQKQLHEISQNTFAIAENTALIAENGGAGTGATAATGVVPDNMVVALRQAIFGQESGYNFKAVNPHSGALGFGQVMPANVASWTKDALGTSLTPSQFLNDPKAQIAVADFTLGKYLREQMSQTGGDINTAVRRVAASWYGGEKNANMYDDMRPQMYKGHKYPSFNEYTNSILNKFLGGGLSIDPQETQQRNEVNSRIMRGYKLPLPTEQNIIGAKGTMDDPDAVISIYTELISLTAQFNAQIDEAIGLERERLRLTIESGVKDVDTQKAITAAIQSRFEEATRVYRELQAQRYVDATGFQESEENRQRIFMEVELTRRRAAEDTKDAIIRVQKEIEEVSLGSSDRIRLAYLEAVKAQSRASEDALTSIAQNIPKLEAAATLNMDVVNASVIDWLAQQKSVSQVYADSITNFMEGTFGAIDNLLDRVTGKLGIFGGFVSDMFGGLLKAGLTQAYAGAFGGAMDTVKNIAGGGTQSVGRMDIQSAGQVIINSTGVTGATASLAAAVGGVGLPAPVAQAMQRGMIPFTPQQGGGVFTIGNTGMVTNANGAPVGILPTAAGIAGIGMGGGGITNAAAARNAALSSIFSGGGFGIGPGGTAPFHQAGGAVDLGTLLGIGGLGGATAGAATQAPRTGVGGIFSSILTAGKGFFGQVLGGGKFGGIFGTKATGGTFGFGNSQFASMLPLLGASFGGQLGGSSMLGNILGTAGGALAGIGLMGAPAILTGSGALAGSLGFLAPLFSNPFTAIAGGALLVGALLLGRNSKRRKEEEQRTKILGDSKSRLQQILRAVQRDRMDGPSAEAQAQAIRQEYLDAVGQLKDKKTRNIAIATVRELDALITQISAAARQQERRRELDNLLVPEWAGGGMVGSAHTYGQGRGGVVAGVDMGSDTVLARLRPREVVMNLHQQRRAASIYGGDFFRNAGVPGFASGGSYSPAPMAGNHRTVDSNKGTTVIVVFDEAAAKEVARKTGGEIINMSANSLKNADGPLYREVKKLRG